MTGSTMKVGGVVTFWTLSEWTSREALLAGFTKLNLNNFVPEPRTDLAALRDALGAVFPRHLIQPLKSRNAFEVRRIDRGENENEYPRVATYGWHETWSVRVLAGSHEEKDKVSERHGHYKKLISVSQVTTCLTELLASINATRLRPAGGLYWLSENQAEQFIHAAKVVEASKVRGDSRVYFIRHAMDAEAVRAVRDAIINEVTSESARIKHEVLEGDMGKRAMQTRQEQAESMRAKVKLYEDLLSQPLANCHMAIDTLEEAAAAASLLASASDMVSNGQEVPA